MRGSTSDSGGGKKVVWCCLYTRQKTQKRKKWQDGKFVIWSGKRGVLYSMNDGCEIEIDSTDNIPMNPSSMMETEKHIITLEELWTDKNNNNHETNQHSISRTNGVNRYSTQMQKLFQRKFVKKKAYIPPSSTTSNTVPTWQQKRKRPPLQPGEYQRQYFNNNNNPSYPNDTDAPQNQYSNRSNDGFENGNSRNPYSNQYTNNMKHRIDNNNSYSNQFTDDSNNTLKDENANPSSNDTSKLQSAFVSNNFDPQAYYGNDSSSSDSEDSSDDGEDTGVKNKTKQMTNHISTVDRNDNPNIPTKRSKLTNNNNNFLDQFAADVENPPPPENYLQLGNHDNNAYTPSTLQENTNNNNNIVTTFQVKPNENHEDMADEVSNNQMGDGMSNEQNEKSTVTNDDLLALFGDDTQTPKTTTQPANESTQTSPENVPEKSPQNQSIWNSSIAESEDVNSHPKVNFSFDVNVPSESSSSSSSSSSEEEGSLASNNS